MATCAEITTYALRLTKVLSSGGDPDLEEAADGLIALQSMYDTMMADGMFGQLADVVTEEAYEAKPGERVRALSGVAVTYPTLIEEEGGEYPPYDLSAIEVYKVATTTREFKIFEAGRGAWVNLVGLASGDTAPLSTRGVMGLAAYHATDSAFHAMFRTDVDPRVERLARQFKRSLMAKLGGDRNKIAADYF